MLSNQESVYAMSFCLDLPGNEENDEFWRYERILYIKCVLINSTLTPFLSNHVIISPRHSLYENILSYFIGMSVLLHVYLCTLYMSGACLVHERTQISWNLDYRQLLTVCRCQELKLGSLEEQAKVNCWAISLDHHVLFTAVVSPFSDATLQVDAESFTGT